MIGISIDKILPRYLLLFSLITVAVLTLLSTGIPFYYDDFSHIIDASYLRHFSLQDGAAGYGWLYRPVLSFTYLVDWVWLGANAAWMRSVNIALHCLNVFLLAVLIKGVLRRNCISLDNPLVWMGLLFFMFHPVAWHSILYISARSTVLVTTFILATIVTYGWHGKKRALSFLFAILAIGTKEIGILAIPLAATLHPTVLRFRRWLLALMAVLLLVSVFFILRKETLFAFWHLISGQTDYPHGLWNHLGSQTLAIMKYIEVLAFPLRWAFFHEVGFELNPFGLQSIVRALALCTGFLGAGLVFYRLNKLIFLFFLAVCISFACEVIYPRELVAIEQRCYLPIAFSAGLLVVGLNLLTTTRPKWSKFFLIGFSLWLAFGASQLVKRVIIYTDPATLFTRELKLYPNSVEALIHSSHINKDAGRYSQAQADLLTVENVVLPRTKVSAWFRRRLNNIFMLRVNLLEANGSADEMQKLVNLCKLYVDSETQCAHHRAQLYIKQGKYDTATRILRLLRVLGWGSIEHDFGLALLALGDKASIQEAGSVLSELFNLNPANIRNANAWLTYLRKTGDMASAQKEKLRAIAAMKRIGVEWRGQLE